MNWLQQIFKKKDTITSNEPYIKIIGDSIDPDRGLELTLDWNDAFIAYLRANGYHGTSEESIIQQWLGKLYADMQQKIQDKLNISSDFE